MIDVDTIKLKTKYIGLGGGMYARYSGYDIVGYGIWHRCGRRHVGHIGRPFNDQGQLDDHYEWWIEWFTFFDGEGIEWGKANTFEDAVNGVKMAIGKKEMCGVPTKINAELIDRVGGFILREVLTIKWIDEGIDYDGETGVMTEESVTEILKDALKIAGLA